MVTVLLVIIGPIQRRIAENRAYFEDLQKTYFSDRIKKLEHRWVKRIDLNVDYVEK